MKFQITDNNKGQAPCVGDYILLFDKTFGYRFYLISKIRKMKNKILIRARRTTKSQFFHDRQLNKIEVFEVKSSKESDVIEVRRLDDL